MSKESKFLSRVLRHEPDLIGLTLGPGGWVQVDELLRGMKRAGHRLSPDALRQIVTDNDKQRFTLSDDGRRIRAAQGHSIAVDLDLTPIEPPATLFHGTARDNLDAIFASGLNPGRRQHVHLSPDEETAVKVGSRHGRPVVLRVNTAAMHVNGLLFWRADNGVWLTAAVPPEYLGF
ncbi:RNA 2'-phosphotransferase [Antarcticimicrobium sediminis]|uniref:Probable RNA 2'-phosphotransferase n=1 Tax=Antarcticimicrobium sediminis TaxID=2546227 RepID=A0A4R5ELK3_9RHOB|nr:RNA 2'-phosphotransferase [Antarcticimicrobium sediminis]TDE35444.1 RNA 2'-phosphotransferase [Antarcticimicrobium sediminis]